MYTFTVR